MLSLLFILIDTSSIEDYRLVENKEFVDGG